MTATEGVSVTAGRGRIPGDRAARCGSGTVTVTAGTGVWSADTTQVRTGIVPSSQHDGATATLAMPECMADIRWC
jgi:hypothetical protein